MPSYKECKVCARWTLNIASKVCENPECRSLRSQLASELVTLDRPRSPESRIDDLPRKDDAPASVDSKPSPEFQLKPVIAAATAIIGTAAVAWWVIQNTKRGQVRRRSTIPYSARGFAKELVASGKSFPAIVEANNPLSRELTDSDVQEIANAVAGEVLKTLKSDPEFRRIVREEATALKRTLPSNMLASAIVTGISTALGLPIFAL